jgi:hypothetical protein
MTLKGSGSRDIARVLPGGPNTGLKELKKSVRPLAGTPKRGEGVVSGRDKGRRAARGGDRDRGNGEFCGEQGPSTLVVACD